MELVARTHRGRLRPRNEDAVAVDTRLGVAVLADGMGGLLDGDAASREAVAAVLEALRERSGEDPIAAPDAAELAAAARAANARVLACGRRRGGLMGTTLEILCLDATGRARLVHAGDSRAYRFRSDGAIEQLTRDHSLVQDLIDRGRLTADAARRSPQRNVVTRAAGLDETLDVQQLDVELARGELLMLCSDGLWEMLEDDAIAALLAAFAAGAGDLEKAADALVAAANRAGGVDNVSVILARR